MVFTWIFSIWDFKELSLHLTLCKSRYDVSNNFFYCQCHIALLGISENYSKAILKWYWAWNNYFRWYWKRFRCLEISKNLTELVSLNKLLYDITDTILLVLVTRKHSLALLKWFWVNNKVNFVWYMDIQAFCNDVLSCMTMRICYSKHFIIFFSSYV